MTSNPTDGIRLMQFDEVTKAILSLKEIQKLAITPCPNNEVKRAFLFSCYCGLRWCDVHQLQYKDIDFSSNRLTILQQKVQSHSKNAILHLNLNHTAIKLLQRHKGINEELVFGLPSYSYTLRILNKWVKRANIHKHITFHGLRHSGFSFSLKFNSLQNIFSLTGNDLETSEILYFTSFCSNSKERFS